MPRTIRFHLDEPRHRRSPIAPLGAWIETNTQDRDFLRIAAAGSSHADVAYCPEDSKSIGTIIQGLVFIWEVLEPGEMVGRVEYV